MKFVLAVLTLVLFSLDAWSQCAMCKTTIVNNVSHGELALAEGLNFGIMYLFASPYLAIIVVLSVWFYYYRKHVKKQRAGHTGL